MDFVFYHRFQMISAQYCFLRYYGPLLDSLVHSLKFFLYKYSHTHTPPTPKLSISAPFTNNAIESACYHNHEKVVWLLCGVYRYGTIRVVLSLGIINVALRNTSCSVLAPE